MTTDELIALAREGKAHIEPLSTCIVTRYAVTAREDDDPEETIALYISVCDEGTIHDAYAADPEGENRELTGDEAEVLRKLAA